MALNIPDTDIWSFLFERSETPYPQSHTIFRSTSSSEKSYSDIRHASENFGKNLRLQWNWESGQVLVIVSPNSIETPALIWGCHWAGGVVSPANPSYTADELRYHLVDSEARGLVVHQSLLAVGKTAAKMAGIPESRILVIYNEDGDASNNPDSVHRMLVSPPLACQRPTVRSSDLAFLVYSSGTTGLPKGGMLVHSNVVSSMVMQSQIEGPHMSWQKDRILAVLPTYHIYGAVVPCLFCLVHLPIYLGLQTIVMEKFTLSGLINHVRDFSITHAYVAPPVVLYLSKISETQGQNLSLLRMLTSGGAPLGRELILSVYQRLRIPVRQAFGLTESTAVSHIQRWKEWKDGIGSNGPPLNGLEVKFIDDDEKVVSEGEGQLCMRGPTIFKGYFKKPSATESCLTPDGWFKTGDIGFQDNHCNLYITDRIKDLIKFKGYQIAPAELESILHGHPDVGDVAIVGSFNDKIASEFPVAYVVVKDQKKATVETARNMIEYAAARVAPYKRLSGGIVWIDEIPKSPSGKILKRILKARLSGVDKGKALEAIQYVEPTASKAKL